MQCLRCAGAPRRPASGSALSLTIPSQHVALNVPGEPVAAHTQFLRDERLPSPRDPNGSALPKSTLSGLTGSLSLQPAELLASLSEAFTSGLSTVWSPAPPPDITTVSTGQSPPAGLSPAGMAASVAAQSPWVPKATHSRHPAPAPSHFRRARRPESSLQIVSSASFLPRQHPGRQPSSLLRFAELQDELVGVSANRLVEHFGRAGVRRIGENRTLGVELEARGFDLSAHGRGLDAM